MGSGLIGGISDFLFGNPYDGVEAKLGNANTQLYGLQGVAGQQYQNRRIDPQAQAMLLAQANGTAPSAAQAQLMQGLQDSQSMAGGMAMSNANMSPMLAQRQALQSQSNMALRTNSQLATLRAGEQQQGQSMYANYMLNQQSQNDQMVRYFQSLGFSMDESLMKAQMALAGAKADATRSNEGALLGVGGAVAGGMLGGAGGAVVGGMAGGKMMGGGGGLSQGSSADVGYSNPDDLNSTYGTPNAPSGYYQ